MAEITQAPEEDQSVTEETEETQTQEDKQAETVATNSNQWEENAKVAQEVSKERFGRIKNFFRAYWAKKKWTLPVTLLALLILLLAVPFTRYELVGLFIHEHVAIKAVDSVTGQPVIGADIKVNGATLRTGSDGIAHGSIKLGNAALNIHKQYYADKTEHVTIAWPKTQKAFMIKLVATGRQVPIIIRDKISGKGIAGAELRVGTSDVKTDKDGMAKIVLATTTSTVKGKVIAAGYNTFTVTVLITDELTHNIFEATPSGKLYFLSNLSGKIDVVKTNLDGTGRTTVLAGTGKEDQYTTALLASRDWKYLALLSKRDGQEGIYLIDTSNDNVTNIDGGSANARFTLVGWSGDTFAYEVIRSNISNWQPGAQSLKSYDATTSKLYSIDQTQGEGTGANDYGYNTFGGVSILDNELVYTKSWYGVNGHLAGKNASLISVKPDGSAKKTVKDFPVPATANYGYTLGSILYQPGELYVQAPNNDIATNTYYTYENGKLSQSSTVTDDTYNKPYPTFLVSPSGKLTFWSEIRDNKNTLFIGDNSGNNAKQIASLSEYKPYGWYSDDYLLVSVNGSQLYILPVTGSTRAVKMTDYYKPQLTFSGYGGGYGGL